MISNSNLVDTVSLSTAAYLSLLRNQDGGNSTFQASDVRQAERKITLVNNETWPVIECRLDRKQNLKSDSGAYFVAISHPGTKIPARIISYDNQTGHSEIAVESLPDGESGNLIIDFTWLVERCLTWLQKNGTTVSNPFLNPVHAGIPFTKEKSLTELSDEQIAAVQMLLENPVAYVWGPPGTGKTRHVLAETVAHLVRNKRRVLVVASTNLAVDNAIDAVLSLQIVEDSRILRMGIPSDEFRKKWPDCCEERALKNRLDDLEASEEIVIRRIGARKRLEELAVLISTAESGVVAYQDKVADLAKAKQGLDAALVETLSRNSELGAEVARLESETGELNAARDELRFPALQKGLAALEEEQVRLIAERQDAERQLAGLSVWSKWLTSKRGLIEGKLRQAETRLAQVETTLGSQRNRKSNVETEFLRLEAEISARRSTWLAQEKQWNEGERLAASFRKEIGMIEQSLILNGENLESETSELGAMKQESNGLLGLGELPDEGQLVHLHEELLHIRAQSYKIQQDLSQKIVMGTTLDGFIGMSMNQAIQFDHIVVDEAGYAPLAKVIPLLGQHCPISLLGDHKQLPPVFVGDGDVLAESYWGVSTLYLEEAFRVGIGNDPQQMVMTSAKSPRFGMMRRSSLTKSYRFGPELAELLDRHFYEIGLKSMSKTGTTIRVIGCDPMDTPGRKKRQNPGEAVNVVNFVEKWLSWPAPNKSTLAILTPYNLQVPLICKELRRFQKHPEYHLIEVLNVHKSQGREWDSVFFSASDGALPGNDPFFADSNDPVGALVLNTAISRAKGHLRFFIDQQFWKTRRPESLLTEIAQGG